MIAGTMRPPFASRPMTAGGPPPEANTRSKPVRPAGRLAEVLDDLDHATADHDVPQQLGGPGVDLVIALLGEPRAVFLLAGRQPVASTGRVCQRSAVDPARIRHGSKRDPATGRRGERRLTRTSGHSLNSSVSQRPKRPGTGSSGASGTRSWSACQVARVAASTASRFGRPLTGTGSPTSTRTRPPNESQLVPRMATGTRGTPERIAKYAAPSLSGRSSTRARGCGPPRRSRHPTRLEHRPVRRVASRRSFLPGLYGIAAPSTIISRLRPRRSSPPPSDRRSTAAAGSADRHQDERIDPVQVVEAVDRGAWKMPATDDRPEQGARGIQTRRARASSGSCAGPGGRPLRAALYVRRRSGGRAA